MGAPPADARPGDGQGPSTDAFVLPGGDIGCLLIHGFTGTPYEMRFVGEQLHAAGYTVSAVRLAGHTTQVEDLAQFARSDWYASVNEGFEALMAQCRRCVVVGLSLGSLLALRLAIDRPDAIGGLVLLSSALVLANPWPARVSRFLHPLLPWLPRRWQYVHKGASDIADDAARAMHPGYRVMPVRGIMELVALQREVRRALPLVRQPTLIIHSAQDHTAPIVNLTLLERSLPSVRRTVVLERSFHVLTVDAEKELVAQEITQFVGDTVGSAGDSDFPLVSSQHLPVTMIAPRDAIGLCNSCCHVRRIESRRGSVFILCEKSTTDPDHFSRYPRLPVRTCPGYEQPSAADK